MGAYWRVVKSLELTGNRPRLLPTPTFRVGRVLPRHLVLSDPVRDRLRGGTRAILTET